MTNTQSLVPPLLGLGVVCVLMADQAVVMSGISPGAGLGVSLALLAALAVLAEPLVWRRNRGASVSEKEHEFPRNTGIQRSTVITSMDAVSEPMALLRVAPSGQGAPASGLEAIQVIYANAGWAALVGMSARELRGRLLSEWLRLDGGGLNEKYSFPRDCCGLPWAVVDRGCAEASRMNLQFRWMRLEGENFYVASLTALAIDQERGEGASEAGRNAGKAAWSHAA